MKNMFLCLLFVSSILNAKEIYIKNTEYAASAKNSQYLRFDLVAWKVGIFKSTFKSFANKFKVTYDVNSHFAKNINVSLDVLDLDTEVAARNEKMWDFCFDQKNHSSVTVSILKDVDLESSQKQVVPAQMTIRGQKHSINIEVQVVKEADGYRVHGESLLSLKQLGIPDPSIAVATLEDAVKIYFQLKDK